MERIEVFKILKKRIDDLDLNHPARVGIDGVDGAGKTIFSDGFAEYLQDVGKQVIRSSIDGFHYPKQIRYQKGRYSPEGYYFDSFNYPAIIDSLLKPLGPDGSLRYKKAIFNYINNSEVKQSIEKAEDNAILIFDGVFLCRPEIVDYWDFIIFLDVPFEVTLERVKERDTDKSYFGSEPEIVDKYTNRYTTGQKLYINQAKPKQKSDIIINNSDYHNPKIIK